MPRKGLLKSTNTSNASSMFPAAPSTTPFDSTLVDDIKIIEP